MLTLFALDGLFLLLTYGVWGVLLGTCVYSERYTLATLAVIALVAVLSLSGNLDAGAAWRYCLDNPVLIGVSALGFLGVGVVWARIKWGLMTDRLKIRVDQWKVEIKKLSERETAKYEADLAKYESSKHGCPISLNRPPTKPEVRTFDNVSLPSDLHGRVEVVTGQRLAIRIENYKSRIIGWMAYWPISVVLWLIGDFIHDLFEKLYQMVRNSFQRLADDKLNA